jgi:hypothetical protein
MTARFNFPDQCSCMAAQRIAADGANEQQHQSGELFDPLAASIRATLMLR